MYWSILITVSTLYHKEIVILYLKFVELRSFIIFFDQYKWNSRKRILLLYYRKIFCRKSHDFSELRVLRSAILHLLVVSFRSNDIWIPFESIHDLCIGKLVLHYVCLLHIFKVNLPGTSKIYTKWTCSWRAQTLLF